MDWFVVSKPAITFDILRMPFSLAKCPFMHFLFASSCFLQFLCNILDACASFEHCNLGSIIPLGQLPHAKH